MMKLCGHTIDETLLEESPVVLDVGSRNYAFAGEILSLRPQARVVCVEPDPECPLPPGEQPQTDAGSHPRITLINKALVGVYRENAPYCFYSTGEGNYLNIYPWFNPNPGLLVDVPCITMNGLCVETGISHWDLVKLDCEGAEFEVLENWPGSTWADQISVEFHDFTSLFRHNDKYYEELFASLKPYRVRLHEITEIGPGKARGHWDSLVTL